MLVVASTASSKAAFRVFSVLNSVDLDLLPTDILKADIIGDIEDPQKRREATKTWEEFEDATGRDGFLERTLIRDRPNSLVRAMLQSGVMGEVDLRDLITHQYARPKPPVVSASRKDRDYA